MPELYRRIVVGQPDFEGDKTPVTLSYDYVRDEQAEKDARVGKLIRAMQAHGEWLGYFYRGERDVITGNYKGQWQVHDMELSGSGDTIAEALEETYGHLFTEAEQKGATDGSIS